MDVSSFSGREPVNDYLAVNRELQAYNPDLADRPQIVVATKIDALDDPDRLESLGNKRKPTVLPFFAISSVANKGTKELVAAIAVQAR